MEFQTRNDASDILFFNSMIDALNHAIENKSVWKISFTIRETGERIRLVKSEHGWILEDIYGNR